MSNKYHAKRTWSELCRRSFDSKAEAIRGEELRMLEMAGEIRKLGYQPKFVLCEKPRVTITLDFVYIEGKGVDAKWVYEDVKGVLTRDSRTKLAWLKEKYSIEVRLIR
jgi:hypothetical protein